MEIPEESMLDILTQERLYNALEKALCSSEDYQSVKEEMKKVNNRLEKAGLSKKQDKVIEDLLSVANYRSAVYGAIAYQQGICNGIKLLHEVRFICQSEKLFGKGVEDYGDAV